MMIMMIKKIEDSGLHRLLIVNHADCMARSCGMAERFA